MKKSTNELILSAKALYSLRVENTGEFFGLLCPPKDDSIYHYQYPALGVYSEISERGTLVVIHSIDNSGLSIWFREGGRKPLDKFREFLSNSHIYICPTEEEILAFCRENNAYADYW